MISGLAIGRKIDAFFGKRLFLFLASPGTVFLFGDFEGLSQTDHVLAGAKGVHGFGFALEGFGVVVGGLDGETNAALGLIDLDDAGFHFLADLEGVLDFFDTLFADLRDVDEAVDVVLELHEGTKVGDFRDGALDEIADLEATVDFLPGIVLELFDAEADALVDLVDVDDDGFEFVALFEGFARVVDLAGPGKVGHVNHAVDAFFQFHKRAVGGHVADGALDLLADHVADFDLVPWVRLELADAEGDLLLVFVDAEDHRFDFLAEREHVERTGDALGPREFGDVDEASPHLLRSE